MKLRFFTRPRRGDIQAGSAPTDAGGWGMEERSGLQFDCRAVVVRCRSVRGEYLAPGRLLQARDDAAEFQSSVVVIVLWTQCLFDDVPINAGCQRNTGRGVQDVVHAHRRQGAGTHARFGAYPTTPDFIGPHGGSVKTQA